MRPAVQLVWFKKDLRVYDHAPLKRAALRGPVLPLYVCERLLWREPDMSLRHFQFLRESIEDLDRQLASIGQRLIIRSGSVTEILDDLKNTFRLETLWSHEETGNDWTFQRDKAVHAWCKEQGVPWIELPQTGVIRRLNSRYGWSKKWDQFMGQEPVDPPKLSQICEIQSEALPHITELGLGADGCHQRQFGGRSAGLNTLESFLFSRGKTYRSAMATPVDAFNSCSRLSPHLAFGTLSVREVTQATWHRQRDIKLHEARDQKMWSAAMRSFSSRLHWHCHFMQKLEDEPRIEHQNLHRAYDGLRSNSPDRLRLEAWQAGETGFPFVDACMRALRATGWMNFRMRAMLTAFSSYHLWLDWREPGLHLARLFTDYEPGIHWSQIQMQSGTTGINTVRVYNPVKQGMDQDPKGVFVRKWVPELAEIDVKYIHEPWKAENASRVLGKIYPFPIVDHLEAAKEARSKVWAMRKGSEYRQEASSIQVKHGSKKSGLSNTKRAPKRSRVLKDQANQPDLFG